MSSAPGRHNGAMPPTGPTPLSDELERLRFDDADGFDIALRRRTTAEHGEVFELVVNGMFAMDSVDASSEVALAGLVDRDARRVLVGGLGLGFTAGALLDRLPGVQVDVVELSGGLVRWAGEGLVPSLSRVAGDPRCTLVHADVADWIRAAADAAGTSAGGRSGEPAGSGVRGHSRGSEVGRPPAQGYDAVLLDVDNGPDFLIHDHNARLYGDDLLAAAHGCLAPGGLLAVWCEGETPGLHEALARLDPSPGLVVVGVDRDGHHVDYAIHTARR